MPPNYDSEEFWDTRFKTETHFEWLGSGRESILPVLRSYFQLRLTSNPPIELPPLLLHIGAGTSTLSNDLLEEYHKAYPTASHKPLIVNTDFAEEAVRRGNDTTSGEGEVVWERVDLMRWKEVFALKEKMVHTTGRKFDVVVDKSTTDAISCMADVVYRSDTLSGSPRDAHPLIDYTVSRSASKEITFHPAAVLALHLASVVETGGVWIALSYSQNRFPFFGQDGELDLSLFWTVERVEPVLVRQEVDKQSEGTVHTPDVYDHLYILRRTDVVVAME